MFLRALLPLLLVGAPSRRVLLASASTIKDAEVDKCITCVTASSSESSASSFSFSWTDGTCSPGTTCSDSSDPGTGPRCCVDDRCCSEDGCRSPTDNYSLVDGGTSCEQCCDEAPTSDGDGVECKIRSFSSEGSDGSTAPWYNDETDVPGGCQADCPPCAVCSSRDESELTDLASGRSARLEDCTAEMCEAKKSLEYFADPCQFNSAAGDCDCFCSMANPLLDDCPHLSEGVFNGTGGGNAQQEPAQDDPVQEDPVQDTQSQDDAGQQDGSAGGTGAEPVDDSFGDVPAGEKQVGRSTSGAAGGVASACVRATLSAGCLAGAIMLVLS